ncbi:hypothetical protein [Foetidibacter luteolus]|uniref:hypothetical protein n=1 Tax=Foetidibacter luteolus TaxID=2608880 RepID=UPI00129B2ED4|nr:hypothetical protein [Foetidibacter luteolus]
MKSTHVALAAIALSSLLFSCTKSGSGTPEEQVPAIVISNDADGLTKRISTNTAGVVAINGASKTGRFSNGKEYGVLDTSNPYPIELIAEVAPPVYEGSTLKATHVDINGNYAYVSYNTEGEKYLGAVDVFDITTAAKPKLLAEAIFTSADINALVYNNGRLYITGAADKEKNSTLTSNAIVGYVNLSGNVPTGDYKIFSVPGFSGTDISFANSKLYVSSGANGGLSVIDQATLTTSKYLEQRDLRAVAVSSGGKLSVLSGEKGVSVFNATSYTLSTSVNTGTDAAASKRTIDYYNENLLVAGGKNGMVWYNGSTGAKIDDILLPKTPPAGIDPNDIVTNAVSNNDGIFLAANGAAGVYLSIPKSATTLSLVGSMDLKGSSNYVKSKGDYIYVATGTGGLKILKFTRPATTVSCTSFPVYKGDANLNVNSNDDFKYSGSASLQNLNVGGKLYFCGALSVLYNCNINSNGVLEVHGAMAFGTSGNSNLNLNSTLNVEGSLVIYGNLTMNSGAKLNFLGSGSTLTIYGKFTKNSGAAITGNYTDTFGKTK